MKHCSISIKPCRNSKNSVFHWSDLCKAALDDLVARYDLSDAEKAKFKSNYLALLESKETTCCFCGKKIQVDSDTWGNNPDPCVSKEQFISAARCCDKCDEEIVIPKRIQYMDNRLPTRRYSKLS